MLMLFDYSVGAHVRTQRKIRSVGRFSFLMVLKNTGCDLCVLRNNKNGEGGGWGLGGAHVRTRRRIRSAGRFSFSMVLRNTGCDLCVLRGNKNGEGGGGGVGWGGVGRAWCVS